MYLSEFLKLLFENERVTFARKEDEIVVTFDIPVPGKDLLGITNTLWIPIYSLDRKYTYSQVIDGLGQAARKAKEESKK